MTIENTTRPHPNPLPEGEGARTALALLREWTSVCDAIEAGRNLVLIRKGGIAEGKHGFELKKTFFGLLPTLFHQVKSDNPAADAPEPPRVVTLICQLVEAYLVPSATLLETIGAFHAYTPEQLAKRQHYKPERPLNLLIVRPFRLRQPIEIAPGEVRTVCRSWDEISLTAGMGGIEPVLDATRCEQAIDQLRQAITALPEVQRIHT
jgi:hypothetical protein